MHQVFETQFDTRWDALLLRLDFNLSQMLRVLLLSVMHSLWRCISSHSSSFLHRCCSSAAGSCLRSLQSYSRLSFSLSLATLLEIDSNLSCISASYNFTRWSCSAFFSVNFMLLLHGSTKLFFLHSANISQHHRQQPQRANDDSMMWEKRRKKSNEKKGNIFMIASASITKLIQNGRLFIFPHIQR